MKIKQPTTWGITPVPQEHRILGFFDFFILWADLGVGLLVILAGSFLIPGLSLSFALLAIITGSAIGCLLLGLVGIIGSKTHAPTMVLLRSVLGIRGSYLPSFLNIVQLVGWTIFEFVIMGYTASTILKSVFGFSNHLVTTALFAGVVIIMGLSGLRVVVRQWLRRVAIWIVLGTTILITYHLLSMHSLASLFAKKGDGSISFWAGVDLVIAMPISWLPLIADYNRFAKSPKSSFYATFIGYFLANVWLYFIGALLLLATGITQETRGFVSAILLSTGWFALLILLVDETKEAWADLYSSVVSAQNIFPGIDYKRAVIGFGLLAFIVAVLLDITQYQNFLYLIGSVFVPLFALLITDYFVINKGKIDHKALYKPNGQFWFFKGVNIGAVVIWAMGVGLYQYIANHLSWMGASLPSFVAVVGVYLVYQFAMLPLFKKFLP